VAAISAQRGLNAQFTTRSSEPEEVRQPFVQTPAELRAELAASLAALGTTYIDLLILNRPSPMLRIEDTMGE